jgi:hypothetical protein
MEDNLLSGPLFIRSQEAVVLVAVMEAINDLDGSAPSTEPVNKSTHIDLSLFSCLQSLESTLALLTGSIALIHTCDTVR